MRTKFITYFFLGFCLMSPAQTKMPNIFKSSFVQIVNNKLIYHADSLGNIIPDFSRVGYHHGDVPIPSLPTTMTISPITGDNTAHIQQAIDQLAKKNADDQGHRGTLLLKKGIYRVESTIAIKTGGIIIRGEGSEPHETCIIGTSPHRYPIFLIEGVGLPQKVEASQTSITDDFIPVGSYQLHVASAKMFKVGDSIMVFRPGSEKWIHDIKMDQIVARPGTRQWSAEQYDLAFERVIVKIDGNTLYIDNPIVMQMDRQYGGGKVYKYTFKGRIHEIGIENLCIESNYKNYEDTEHAWTGIKIDKAEDCWVNNITTRYIANSAVWCERYAKNVTVLNSRCLEPKSIITGGYRYSFYNNGQQNLFMNCMTTEGRHDYVTGARVLGPNVFYNCYSTQVYADIGPHHRWACGTLYDNIVTDGEINVQDRGNMGSGHGWAGVTQVLWNCRVKSAAVQNPWVSGKNYSIGTKGIHRPGVHKNRPDGEWEGENETNMEIRSLYEAQLLCRKGLSLELLNK